MAQSVKVRLGMPGREHTAGLLTLFESKWERRLAAILVAKRLAGVAPEVNFEEQIKS